MAVVKKRKKCWYSDQFRKLLIFIKIAETGFRKNVITILKIYFGLKVTQLQFYLNFEFLAELCLRFFLSSAILRKINFPIYAETYIFKMTE